LATPVLSAKNQVSKSAEKRRKAPKSAEKRRKFGADFRRFRHGAVKEGSMAPSLLERLT